MSQGSDRSGGRGPNRGGGRSGGKRPMYEDLDAPPCTDWTMSDSGTGSGSGGPSSGHKKSKRLDAHEKNPGYPPREYTAFARPVAMKFYAHRSMEMLERTYLDHGFDGFVLLCQDLCKEFMKEFDQSELYNNYLDYWDHVKWIDQITTTNTNNVVKGSFEVVYPKKKDEEYDESKKQLLAKLLKVEAACRKHSAHRTKTLPWRVQALKGAMEAHMGGGVVWLPPHAKVIEIPGDRVEGGYAKIRRVRIARMENIPSDIDFAGKMPKADDHLDQRKERSMEALACSVSHVGVIKFWALHQDTMEAYTLWWNGGSLHSFWTKYDSKVRPGISDDEYHLVNVEGLVPADVDRVKVYRKNRVKLALSLLTIMDKCHAQNILHNDLSPSNIMLHFPPGKSGNVYIGVCDWGMASRVKENVASLYGYQKKEEMEANIAQRKHVAPELFYLFGAKDSLNSLEIMKKKHLYTKATDAYSVGVLATKIWNKECDKTLLPNSTIRDGFGLKLAGLRDKDPQTRLSIQDVLRRLTSPPFNMVMPECCFRKEI
jgi:hypothetical protein